MNRIFHKACMLVVAGALSATVSAQEYPVRPITMVVPFPPGAIYDWTGRTVADRLQKRTGQPVVVDNKIGGAGLIGMQAVAKAAPDGYTLLTLATPQANPSVWVKDAPVDVGRDLAAVNSLFYAPYVVYINGSVSAKTLGEYVAQVKANPGKLNYASITNSSLMLDTIDLVRRSGMSMAEIPYPGSAQVTRAILANEVQFYIGTSFGLEEHVKSGRIRTLAVTSAVEFPPLRELPTVKSAIGLDFDSTAYYGVFTGAGVPKPVVARLAALIDEMSKDNELRSQIRARGFEPLALGNEGFGNHFANEAKRAQDIARQAGIKAQ